ncbi:SUPPRESSOR OF GENE SILENCING 3 [Olea europaea subsp. europaea]|uniref:SUPPRESSOR OF GENE SILENCING 3 n=1 Tax=Olea europaea subsp. europaea TaxID=158383 RepID=A0A8S0P7W2_OLEEU|nr:SUPPRESSOR OF GENE SILENCING 3 [Olea europaea subsp. europaea]
MSSGKWGSNPSSSGRSGPSFKGKGVSNISSPAVEQLSHGVSDLNLGSTQDDGWGVVYGKKSKNRTGSSAPKQWGPKNSNPPHRAWDNPDTVQKLGLQNSGGSGQTQPALPSDSRRSMGRGNGKLQSSNLCPDANYVATPAVIPPPLKNGWEWSTRTSNQSSEAGQRFNPGDALAADVDDEEEEEELSDVDDDTDEGLLSDDFDSDESQKSHETRKKNRWFKELFDCLDTLTVEQINEPERQWHCPACKGGPGAIDWYRGLQPLISHARTKGSKRMKLHRELAELLDEELKRRGTSVVTAGETFGKWKGLKEIADKEIVWPPMMIIMNTRLEKDDKDQWVGMGNQELLDYFSPYAAVKARHSYGPQGHRGISILIFEASAVGYAEAERLSKHFEDNGRDKKGWEQNRVPFYAGGQRQLYGYMAEMRDLDNFNYHCHGKSKLKYEMRSYQEMVVNQMKQMSEDNQQLMWFKNKVAKEQRNNKALEESFGLISEKLRKTMEENRIVRLRTKMHHEQHKEEMDYQEQFFKDQIKQLYDARNVKEETFEKIQQDQRVKVTETVVNLSSIGDRKSREEKIEKFIRLQDEEMEEYVAGREKLMKAHEERMVSLRRKHLEEEVALEKEFDEEFNRLMEKYTPHDSKQLGNQEI